MSKDNLFILYQKDKEFWMNVDLSTEFNVLQLLAEKLQKKTSYTYKITKVNMNTNESDIIIIK